MIGLLSPRLSLSGCFDTTTWISLYLAIQCGRGIMLVLDIYYNALRYSRQMIPRDGQHSSPASGCLGLVFYLTIHFKDYGFRDAMKEIETSRRMTHLPFSCRLLLPCHSTCSGEATPRSICWKITNVKSVPGDVRIKSVVSFVHCSKVFQ